MKTRLGKKISGAKAMYQIYNLLINKGTDLESLSEGQEDALKDRFVKMFLTECEYEGDLDSLLCGADKYCAIGTDIYHFYQPNDNRHWVIQRDPENHAIFCVEISHSLSLVKNNPIAFVIQMKKAYREGSNDNSFCYSFVDHPSCVIVLNEFFSEDDMIIQRVHKCETRPGGGCGGERVEAVGKGCLSCKYCPPSMVKSFKN